MRPAIRWDGLASQTCRYTRFPDCLLNSCTFLHICTYIHTSTYTLHVFGHLVLLLYGAVVLNGQDHWVVRHSKGMVLDGLNGIFEHDLASEGVTMVVCRVVLITIGGSWWSGGQK